MRVFSVLFFFVYFFQYLYLCLFMHVYIYVYMYIVHYILYRCVSALLLRFARVVRASQVAYVQLFPYLPP